MSMSERRAAPLLGDDRHSTVLYLIKQVELAIRAQIDEAVVADGEQVGVHVPSVAAIVRREVG